MTNNCKNAFHSATQLYNIKTFSNCLIINNVMCSKFHYLEIERKKTITQQTIIAGWYI